MSPRISNGSVISFLRLRQAKPSSDTDPLPAPNKPHLHTNGNGNHHLSKSPPHHPSTIEYSSSAPLPPSSSSHVQNGEEDEDIPSHLYGKLPAHALESDGRGGKVPDYLRLILMCELIDSFERMEGSSTNNLS